MKKIILIISLILTFSLSIVAQPKALSEDDMEKILNGKAQMMQKKLGLSDEQMKEFLPIYKDYNRAIFAIKLPKKSKVKPENMTSNQAYDEVVGMLKFKKNILDVQEKYVGKMKQLLTPQQLLMFLKTENAVQMSIRNHKKDRSTNVRKRTPRHRKSRNATSNESEKICFKVDSLAQNDLMKDCCEVCSFFEKTV